MSRCCYVPAPFVHEQTKLLLHDGSYSDPIAQTLTMHAWGWHVENGGHILRLFAGGGFDRFPRLKIVSGHMGEMLPYQHDRIIRITDHQCPLAGVKPGRTLKQVVRLERLDHRQRHVLPRADGYIVETI